MSCANTVTIGVSEKNQASYWDVMNAGFLDAGEKLGLKVLFRSPQKENGLEQADMINKLIDEGIDGLAYVGTFPKQLQSAVNRAISLGIPVITFDLDDPFSGRSFFVSTIHLKEFGRLMGKHMFKALNGSGQVVIQVGSVQTPGAIAKVEGFKEFLSGTDVEIVEVINDFEDVQGALDNARQMLKKYPDLKGFYGTYAHHIACQAQAVEEFSRQDQVKIIGFDILPETIEPLKKGIIHTAYWEREYYFGYYAAAVLGNMIHLGVNETLDMMGMDTDDKSRNQLLLQPIAYTSDNIDEYISWKDKTHAWRLIGQHYTR